MSYTPGIRLFVNAPLMEHSVVTLSEGQSHYVMHVMRCSEGEHVLLFNGRDGEWRSTISCLHKKHTNVMVDCCVRSQNQPVVPITLLFAPVKRVAMQSLVAKAVEMGVSVLQPVLTEHTVMHRVDVAKLALQVIEAAEQCERLTVPEVNDAVPLSVFLQRDANGAAVVFCDESGAGGMPSQAFAERYSSYAVLVGPEGGFSEAERALLQSYRPVISVGLGPRILRADTAVVAALTIVQLYCGDLNQLPRFG